MERSLLTLISNGLLGTAAFGMATLGLFWSGPGDPPPGKNEDNWHLLDPISYENLTVFPVVSTSGYDTREFLTLEEGLSRGEVLVREQGTETMLRNRDGVRPAVQNYRGPSVNQLVLVNRSKKPVILLAGELVSGGKQDRVIAKDRIVAPRSEPLPLDVFCVEHGRWSQGANFTSAKTIVHPSVREQAAMKKDQSSVWASVTAGTTSAREGSGRAPAAAPQVSADALSEAVTVEAPTQSYSKLYSSSKVAPSVEAMVNEVERRFKRATGGLKGERVVGVVVAYGGEVAWSDVFASADLFEQYWNKLLRSYAVEAVARPTLREVAAKDDAQEFLQKLNGREKTESEPGVYRWREISEGSLSQIELDALEPKVVTLHRLMVRRTS